MKGNWKTWKQGNRKREWNHKQVEVRIDYKAEQAKKIVHKDTCFHVFQLPESCCLD